MIADRIRFDEISRYVDLRKDFVAGSVSATRFLTRDRVGGLHPNWIGRWEKQFDEITYVVYVHDTPIAWTRIDGTVVEVDCELSEWAQKVQRLVKYAL